ncbi:MAG: anti-sigma factor [Acidobacteriota bacterium]
MNRPADERLLELLAQRATEGLGLADGEELARLLDRDPSWAGDEFDLTAAAIDEALSEAPAALPPALARRVRSDAANFFPPTEEMPASQEELPGQRHPHDLTASPAANRWVPWLVAAAGLLLAVVAWWPQVEAPAPPSAAEQRATLLANADDVQTLPWSATEDLAARGAEGDVVWSSSLQRGFMRIRGLAVNDPNEKQYQLWLFDQQRDDRYPIDGGVFDIPPGADEVIVPIDARLPFEQPALFAVTLEQAGGVVVSDRERIVLAAAVES